MCHCQVKPNLKKAGGSVSNTTNLLARMTAGKIFALDFSFHTEKFCKLNISCISSTVSVAKDTSNAHRSTADL